MFTHLISKFDLLKIVPLLQKCVSIWWLLYPFVAVQDRQSYCDINMEKIAVEMNVTTLDKMKSYGFTIWVTIPDNNINDPKSTTWGNNKWLPSTWLIGWPTKEATGKASNTSDKENLHWLDAVTSAST